MRKVNRVLFACAVATLNLAACSSGGPGNAPAPAPAPTPTPTPPPPPPPPATTLEGLYVGPSGANETLSNMVLENGALWGIVSLPNATSTAALVYGVLQANATPNNGSYGASDGRLYFYNGTPPVATSPQTISASYTATTFNGTATNMTGGVVNFTTNKVTSATYNYDQAAAVSALVGGWNGFSPGGAPSGTALFVNIDAAGAVVGTIAACGFIGTVSPRASGKNVFNVALTFNAMATGCTQLSLTGDATGIAYAYAIGGGKQRLTIAVQNAARDKGIGMFAEK